MCTEQHTWRCLALAMMIFVTQHDDWTGRLGWGEQDIARHRLVGTYLACSACVADGDVYGHVIYVLPCPGTETGWGAGHAIY